ncbi:MAG: hypothetical protein J0H64_10000, partial [Actinobacteria bacterium]|nr:hypothetical protein [Actinomycetota bacterium]
QMRQTIEHWAAPILVDLRHRPLDELLIDAPPAPGWGGAVALSELTPRLLETVLQAVGPECESPFFLAQIRHLGGELADAPGRSGSVAGRGAEYLLFLASAPSQELIDGPVPHLAARVFKSLAPWSTEALPSNFADHLDRSRREGSWPERVRADVREVQRMRDPAGMFRHWAGV